MALPNAGPAVLMAWFVRHALRVAHPLIDVRLLRQRGFAAGAAVNFVLGFHGQIGQAAAIAAASPRAATAPAQAFGTSFAVAFGISAIALIPAVLLPGRPAHDDEPVRGTSPGPATGPQLHRGTA